MANENLLELIECVIPVPEDIAQEVRALPQVPDEWLNGCRKIIERAKEKGKHPSEMGAIRKIKLANEFRKLVKKMRTIKGMPQDGELT